MRLSQKEKPGLPGRIGALFLGASPLRAGVETIVLAAALTPAVFLSPGNAGGTLMPVVGPLAAIFFSVRMRLRAGSWRTKVLREAVSGAVVMALVAALFVPLIISGLSSLVSTLLTAASLVLWYLGAFTFFRILAYLWPRWVGLRRRRLRWEMTHTTLVVVAVVSSIVTLLIVIISLLSSGTLDPFSLLTQLLIILGLMIFLTVVVLAVVLPPAAVISYFAARRTAKRLESLTHGTSGLREGNLGIRVQVDGEDEISDLQKDFNAMAGDLERSVRELRAERDNVEHLLKMQRELVASVSHELRTPVATMRGYLESALDGESKERRIPEDLRDDLEIMGREVVRLQRLIDDLFTLSRAEAGRLSLEIRPTDTATLLARCAAAASEGAWRTGKVEVIQDSEADLPAALADEGRLEQVVRNLLSNAVRHTPPGGIVALSAAAEPDAVIIEVKDTGEGISPEDLDHVFERFYRSDGTRQRDRSGAGLGLAIVKELTEAMGGNIHAESEPGSGSRFVLRLPHA